jgi:hypothetical protein
MLTGVMFLGLIAAMFPLLGISDGDEPEAETDDIPDDIEAAGTGGESLLDAIGPLEETAPLEPTAPDAPDAIPEVPSDEPPLAPADPDALDETPEQLPFKEPLAPTAPDEVEDSYQIGAGVTRSATDPQRQWPGA